MPALCETAELLDVEVDHLAGSLALVAAHRLGWLDLPRDPGQARTFQDTADGCRRDVEFGGDLFAGQR